MKERYVLMVYAQEQNEPSKPFSTLYDFEDDEWRDQALRDIWLDVFHGCGEEGESEPKLTIVEPEDGDCYKDYCDVYVTDQTGISFIFATRITSEVK